MDLTSYTTTLREQLEAVASAGDEHTRTTANLLAAGLEPAARLVLQQALTDLASEITVELPEHVVQLHLTGAGQVGIGLTQHAPAATSTGTAPPTAEEPSSQGPAAGGPEPADAGPESAAGSGQRGSGWAGFDSGGEISRITLRMFDELKGRAEQAASTQGMSLNSWLSHAVQGALGEQARRRQPGSASGPDRHGDEGPSGGHLRGWVQG